MSTLIAFGAFFICVLLSIALGFSLGFAMIFGFVCFLLLGLYHGYHAKFLLKSAAEGMKTALFVLFILVLIGFLTAVWRASGTIAFFVYWGIKLSSLHTFVFAAFLLSAALSLACGSSFGVAGTAGVILMTVARSGGANIGITAAAIISGAYFGERLSPASSAAALTAAVHQVDQRQLQRILWRETPLPLAITAIFFAIASWFFPLSQIDTASLTALSSAFDLSLPIALPALILIGLPFFKVKATISILASCACSALLAIFYQGVAIDTLLRSLFMGYHVNHPQLADILSGGGVITLISSLPIIFLSTAYAGIFQKTDLLAPINSFLSRLYEKFGLFRTHILITLLVCALFCNQSIAIIMCPQLMRPFYEKEKKDNMQLATDVADCAMNLAALIPWSIAATVPLSTIGAPFWAIPLSLYLYIIPLCRMATEKISAKKNDNALANG